MSPRSDLSTACRLSIIIVSFNTRRLTIECIESVYQQTMNLSFELIVVDNASTDGSAESVRESFPQDAYPSLHLICLDRNIGFAAANNHAAEVASGEFILLLNPDTIVMEHALERLVDYAAAHPDAGIYGGSTLFPDGSLNPTAGWRKPTIWSLFSVAVGFARLFPRSRLLNPESLAGHSWEEPFPVEIVTGCLLLIRMEDWRRLRGFDPVFFMYGEDADLCLRASALGMQPVLVPGARIVHYGGASEPVRSDKMVRVFRAKVQLFRRHYGLLKAGALIAMLRLWCVMRISIFFALRLVLPGGGQRLGEWRTVWQRRVEWAVPVSVRGELKPSNLDGVSS